MDTRTESIPVLDLGAARNGDGSFNPAFVAELRDASHRVGFFQLTGYGATGAQVDELFDITRRFFNLPEADRLALDNRKSPHFRGYTRLGHEVTQGGRTHGNSWTSVPSAPPCATIRPSSRTG